MKVTSHTPPIPEFRPIAVTITCESPWEMLAIKALLEHGAGGSFNVPAPAAKLMKPIAAELAPHFTPL